MTECYRPCLSYFPVLSVCSLTMFYFLSILLQIVFEYSMVNFRISYFKISHFHWAFGIKFWLL